MSSSAKGLCGLLGIAALAGCRPPQEPPPAPAPVVTTPPVARAPEASAAPVNEPPAPKADAHEDGRLHWIAHGSALLCTGGTPVRLGLDGTTSVWSAAPTGKAWDWYSLSVSPDGTSAALFGPDGPYLLDGQTGAAKAGPLVHGAELLRTHTLAEGPHLVWSPDGTILVGFMSSLPMSEGPEETPLYLWDGRDGHLVRTITVRGSVAWLLWSPKGDVLYANTGYGSMFNLSAFLGDTITAWRTADGAAIATYSGHTAHPSPSGRFLAIETGHPSRSENPSLRVIDARTQAVARVVPGSFLTWGNDDTWFVGARWPYSDTNAPAGGPTHFTVTLAGGPVEAVELGSGEVAYDVEHGRAATKDVANPYEYRGDESVSLWDVRHGRKIRTLLERTEDAPQSFLAGGAVLELRKDDRRAIDLLALGSGEVLSLTPRVRDGRCDILISSAGDRDARELPAFLARAKP